MAVSRSYKQQLSLGDRIRAAHHSSQKRQGGRFIASCLLGFCSGERLQGFGVWVFLSKCFMASWTHCSWASVQSSMPFLVLKLWEECSVRENVTHPVSTCLVHYSKLMTLPQGRRRKKVRQRKGLMKRCSPHWPKQTPSSLWLLAGEGVPELVALKRVASFCFPIESYLSLQ